VGGGVQLGPLGTAATNRPIVPAADDYDDGEIGGMIGRGNRSTRRKPQTPHAARTRTQAAAVGSQRLTLELRHGLCNFMLSLSVPCTCTRVIQNCGRPSARHGKKCVYEISPDTLSELSHCVKPLINDMRFEVFTAVIV
jgi:hypothetical protein